MKLTLTPQRISANKKNSILGGLAYAKKQEEAYKRNPSYCKLCNCILPQIKKRNKFCSSSCAAKFNNAVKDYTKFKSGPTPKIKEPKLPYSTVYRCKCKHCGIVKLYRTQKRYCDNHSNLYSHKGRAQYWFTFNVFEFPDLFDLNFIKEYGFRSASNPNGVSRDHKVSVNEAIKNNYDPYYIKHVMNCELMLFSENNKKKTKSSITYDELVKLVDNYEGASNRN